MPILVDCSTRGAHEALLNRYGVRGFPTLLFVNSQGEPVGRMSRRDAATLSAQIEDAAAGRAIGGGSSAGEDEDSGGGGPGVFTYLGLAAVVLLYFIAKSRTQA